MIPWDAIGAIGEIGGAVAVVVTLPFLARQVRDASKQFSLGAAMEANDLYSNAWWPIYQRPGVDEHVERKPTRQLLLSTVTKPAPIARAPGEEKHSHFPPNQMYPAYPRST